MSFKVFILDDDVAFAKVVSIRLKGWRNDLEIKTATSIAEARRILDSKETKFELAIFDFHLPDGIGAELFPHPELAEAVVLAMSADQSPSIPGHTVQAGARHYLSKRDVTDPLFIPLIEAMLARKKIEVELIDARLKESAMQSIAVLLSTLKHEINNPLGAVLGGAYLIRSIGSLDQSQQEALKLIEASGNRIKNVIKQLCEAAELEKVSKASEEVYHIPGDAPWGSKKDK